MRIIAGSLRRRIFNPPELVPTRPTTDFAKEGLFNVLTNYFNYENVKFLDLFAGTGSISYEFASRGSKEIHSVEQFNQCADFIEQTAQKYSMPITIHRMDVFKFLDSWKGQKKFEIIFAGPPYALEGISTIPDVVLSKNILHEKGWFIIEHNNKLNFDNHPNIIQKRNYGSTVFSFFSKTKLT